MKFRRRVLSMSRKCRRKRQTLWKKRKRSVWNTYRLIRKWGRLLKAVLQTLMSPTSSIMKQMSTSQFVRINQKFWNRTIRRLRTKSTRIDSRTKVNMIKCKSHWNLNSQRSQWLSPLRSSKKHSSWSQLSNILRLLQCRTQNSSSRSSRNRTSSNKTDPNGRKTNTKFSISMNSWTARAKYNRKGLKRRRRRRKMRTGLYKLRT